MRVQKKDWKKYFNVVFVAVVFLITLWSVFRGEDLGQLWQSLSMANGVHVALGVVCVVAFITGEAAALYYLLRTLGRKARLSRCCLYSFIGFFYSCITPSASGGQPMQVVAMRKDKIPVAVSSVILAIVTITYKLVLVLMGAAVVIIRPERIITYLSPVIGMVYLGLALNVGCIILLLLLVFHPDIVRTGLRWCYRMIHKVRPFKHPEKQFVHLEEIIAQYNGAAEYYRTHKHVILIVLVMAFVQRCVLFLVTWLIYRAFGLYGESLWVIVTLQAMIAVASDMLPLPGGMGVSENLFLKMFLPVFGEALVLPGMVLSRGVSFYTQLLISAVMTMVAALVIRENTTKNG